MLWLRGISHSLVINRCLCWVSENVCVPFVRNLRSLCVNTTKHFFIIYKRLLTLIMLLFFVQSDINVSRHMHKNLEIEIKFFRSLKCFFGFELNKGKVCFKFDVKTVYFILMGYMYLRKGLLKIICYDVS